MTAARAGLAAAVLAALGVAAAGCGGGDSTVKGAPASETMAPPPSAAGAAGTTAAGESGSGRYTESPEPVQTTAPGYSGTQEGAREKGYLSALAQRGVEADPLRDPLIAAGNTVCRVKATGGAAGQSTTIADATAGQVSAGGYSDKPVEEISRAIVDAATGQLCP